MNEPLRNLGWLTPERAESAYNALTSYRFAQRYVEGKAVADISWDTVGYGTRLLARTADSVTGLTDLTESLELASTIYPAKNVSYQKADLPNLPYPDDYFDVAVAFEVIERLESPKALLSEAERVLRPGGTLILSTPDKQTHSNDRNHKDPAHRREMHVPDLRELLEGHFERVRLYRQGVVAGGVVFDAEGASLEASVETTGFASTEPSFGEGRPTTHFVIAVCSDSELPEEDGRPYLLLDDDRRAFDESDDRREDVEFLREEIQRMQKTEVQAFQDALRIERGEVAYLRAELERYETQTKLHEAEAERYEARLRDHEARAERYETRTREQEAQAKRYENRLRNYEARMRNLRAHNERLKKRLRDIEASRIWRLLRLYRRLRARAGGAKR